jgi:hypothetical protein
MPTQVLLKARFRHDYLKFKYELPLTVESSVVFIQCVRKVAVHLGYGT